MKKKTSTRIIPKKVYGKGIKAIGTARKLLIGKK